MQAAGMPSPAHRPPAGNAMPVYDYTALNARGRKITGIIDADNPMLARQRLREKDVFPVSLSEVSVQQATRPGKRRFGWLRFGARVRAADITMLTRQLATLVGAGFPLVSAMDVLILQTKAAHLQKTLARIRESVLEGLSLANALGAYPKIFSPLYINMVRAGETSGTLEIVLERLAEINERRQALKNRIRTALAYPIFMSFIGMLVLFLLMTFIVPTITGIFSDMHQALPTPTRLLIATSTFLKHYWWVLLVLLLAILALLRRIKRTRRGAYFFDRLALKTPGAGMLICKLAVARFARTLGSLLENGVPMIRALDIVRNITANRLISETIEKGAVEVGRGQTLSKSLEMREIFPPLAIQMIQVGEQSGDLEGMLKKVADVYENEVESKVLAMTSLLEPMMILVMGVVVGFIVLSICLPIFEMNQLVK